MALRLEERFAPFRALGAALVGILIGMALSNAGLLPGTSTTYVWLGSHGVSLAVALILLGVDVRTVVEAGPRMLAAFGIGAASTAIGATAGAVALHASVGAETWKLAGQFTGTYTGGGMNFAALGRALETSPDMFSAAVAADVALTAVWMAACLSAPLVFSGGGTKTAPEAEASAVSGGDSRSPDSSPGQGPPASQGVAGELTSSGRPLVLTDIAALAGIAVASVWAADRLASLVPALPSVLWLTTIVLLLAQVPAIKQLKGGALLGNYLLLLFLASNGAQSVIANIFRVGTAVFWFAATTVAVHGIGIFGVGRLLGLDAGTLAVASQANVGGPASAIALATARGYTDRLLSGVAVGLLGYAVGNYAGFAVAALVRGWLGG